jgi:hypothetical protein
MRGDIGDEAARADDGEAGNEPAPLGPSWPCLCPAVAVAVTWERANGDGVCCRAWCMRDACAAARAAIEPERGLGSGGFALELGGGAAASSRLRENSEFSILAERVKKRVTRTSSLFAAQRGP